MTKIEKNAGNNSERNENSKRKPLASWNVSNSPAQIRNKRKSKGCKLGMWNIQELSFMEEEVMWD